jgi:hypothetical protein
MIMLQQQPNLQSIAIKSASLPTSTAPAFTFTAWAPFRVAHLTICQEDMRGFVAMLKVVAVAMTAVMVFVTTNRMCIQGCSIVGAQFLKKRSCFELSKHEEDIR